MEIIRLDLTTNAGGAATTLDTRIVKGRLYAVLLDAGTFDAGVDLTLTCEMPEYSIPLLTILNFNSDQMQYPRVLETLNTSGAALTTHTEPVVAGQIKAIIAQGGNVKSGSVVCYILTDGK